MARVENGLLVNKSLTEMIVVHIETHMGRENKNRLDGLVVSFLAI